MFALARLVSLVILAPFCVATSQTTPPNIIWLWFDDMGMGDVGFLGGTMPTPVLDALAAEKSIRLNFHYAEPICSASRSAFLTGRYAFKSGINTVVRGYWQDRGFNDESNVLFTSIMGGADGPDALDLDYNNMIVGKWHIGMDRESRLPYTNGFNAGLYIFAGRQEYYERDGIVSFTSMDDAFGGLSNETLQERDALFPDGVLFVHQYNRIATDKRGAPYQTAVDLDPDAYNEDLYVDEIKHFLAAQDDSDKPFFVYYSLFTPHTSLAHPPLQRNGEAIDYSACVDAFALNGSACANNSQCLYCASLHYASVGIEEVIAATKANADIDWANTLIVITGDNGPTQPGTAIPLISRKAYAFDGGLRVPTFLLGGLVEEITTDTCEYNEMVHISDWYHMFMDMIGVDVTPDGDYNPDADHADLGIWENIKCRCGSSDAEVLSQCNADNVPRTEMMTMRMCAENGNQTSYMFATAIIKDGYKLIVNGGQNVVFDCPAISSIPGTSSGYISADSSFSAPDRGYFETQYLPTKDRLGALFPAVFGSVCLEELYANNETNITADGYAPYLLYNLAQAKVEACPLNLTDASNAAIRDELLALLENASADYDSPDSDAENVLDWFVTLKESFECESDGSGVVYLTTYDVEETSPGIVYESVWQDLFNQLCSFVSRKNSSTAKFLRQLSNNLGQLSKNLQQEQILFNSCRRFLDSCRRFLDSCRRLFDRIYMSLSNLVQS